MCLYALIYCPEMLALRAHVLEQLAYIERFLVNQRDASSSLILRFHSSLSLVVYRFPEYTETFFYFRFALITNIYRTVAVHNVIFRNKNYERHLSETNLSISHWNLSNSYRRIAVHGFLLLETLFLVDTDRWNRCPVSFNF